MTALVMPTEVSEASQLWAHSPCAGSVFHPESPVSIAVCVTSAVMVLE